MSAFTLTELLVVISLIVLLLALAVPAFNLISGSGSIDQAQNQISAMLSQAQATAVVRENYVGVLFYKDDVTDRTTLALVEKVKPEMWTYERPDPVSGKLAMVYRKGDVVTRATRLLSVPPGMPGEPIGNLPRYYIATSDHTATAGNGPDDGGGNWAFIKPFAVDLVRDKGMPGEPPRLRERVQLPKNVQVQFPFELQQWSVGTKYYRTQRILSGGAVYSAAAEHVATAVPSPGNRPPNGTYWTADPNVERYLHIGLVMFDPSGRAVSDTRGGFSIEANTELAATLPPLPAGELYPFMYARLDFVMFDQEAFRGAGHDDADPMIGGQVNAAEPAEETWLDENGVLLLVHRYSGTLGRAE